MPNTSPLEHIEAVRLANYLAVLKNQKKILRYCHIVNEFKLGRSRMGLIKTMKSEGWQPGVPDYLIVSPKEIIFIELKRSQGGKTSPEQERWIEDLNSLGIKAVVCNGFSDAHKFLQSVL